MIGPLLRRDAADERQIGRLDRLREFWRRVEHASFWGGIPFWSNVADQITGWNAITRGIPGFFESSNEAFRGGDNAGYYSTLPLRKTLTELVDFDLIRKCNPRLTVGAAQVRTGTMHYFDSREMPLTVDHVMASGALPPAFPAVRIDGELYWDGGVVSNTPTEVIFHDNPRRSALIFAVNLWHPTGREPETIFEVMDRYKEMQFASRLNNHIARQRETHRLRHIISELAKHVPLDVRATDVVRDMTAYGCTTRMHVVQLLAPRLDNEGPMKELDFSPAGIRARWQAGHADASEALARADWLGDFSPLEGVILHQAGPCDDREPTIRTLADAAE